jgi:hypothetical protein
MMSGLLDIQLYRKPSTRMAYHRAIWGYWEFVYALCWNEQGDRETLADCEGSLTPWETMPQIWPALTRREPKARKRKFLAVHLPQGARRRWMVRIVIRT